MIFTVHRTATAGLVGTNQLPELSLAGECEGQGEHQEGSEGEIVTMLLVLTGQISHLKLFSFSSMSSSRN